MNTWKTVTVLTGITVLAIAAAQNRGTAGEPRTATAAAACGACHQGKRSLAGRDSEQVAAGIRAILDGDTKHPPLKLDDTSDEGIAELAAELAAAE